jgi:DNA invertase Pin-like site-specific DNA recombinase
MARKKPLDILNTTVYDMTMSKKKIQKAVTYLRVSTREQGDSGLGLEAQRRNVQAFASARGFTIIGEYKDIESGKRNARPGLEAAIARAKAEGAELLIAKLDRLSRDAGFIWNLRGQVNSGLHFTACDLPEANTLTVGVMASMAQYEREIISTRTRAALAGISPEARARSAKAGRRNLDDAARAKGRAARLANALRHYNGAFATAKALHADGHGTPTIARILNESGHRTPRGKLYTAKAVARLLILAEKAEATA